MDFDLTTRLIFGIVSAIGTFAVVFLNSRQAAKVKADLLEKFEVAVEKSQKHSVTELFRLIHGVRMSYSDIIELIKHDECSKIIYAIKKTPGIVRYENGKFSYTAIGKNPIYRFIDPWVTTFGIAFFMLLALLSVFFLTFYDGAAAIAGFCLLLYSAAMVAIQIRQRRYDQMVLNLIDPEITS